jgi:outer membrane protein assembly factor BamA
VYVLGGTGRLRGYKPSRLFGSGLTTFNHEFRSRPLRLFSVLTGLALFHDVGSVFDERFDGFRLRQGAGFGLRILAPQLDRDVFRIDFGFPLVFPEQDDPAAHFTFTASFRQAFSTPVAFPSALLPQ